MNLITPTELARICEITKQATHKAIAEGIIPFTLQGKKKLIDLDNAAVKSYISDNTRQREAAKKNDVYPSKLPDQKLNKSDNRSKLPYEKQASLAIRNMKGGRVYTGKLRMAILERDNHRCKLCGKSPDDGVRLEVDHIKEFEDGGETTYENGQTICAECNKGKSAVKVISGQDEFITLTEFGKRVDAHRNSIADAIKEGRILADKITGKINYTTEVLNWYKYQGAKSGDGDDFSLPDLDGLSVHEINQRSKLADMRKKELQVKILEKKYLPIEFIDNVYITYLERFNSTVERFASTYVKDVGKKIIESGEVLPEHIEYFTQKILETIHNNKKAVHKEVKKFEPHL